MRKNLKNISYMFMVQIANYLLPLITIPIVARALGPVSLGLVGYIGAIVAYFSLLVSYSFNYTGVRRVVREPENESNIFSTIFTVKILLLIISSIVFCVCAEFIPDLKNNYILSMVAFLSCVSILFSQTWFLQAKGDFRTIALLSLIAKVFSVILIFLLINNSNDLILYAFILNLSTLFISVLTFYISIFKYGIDVKLKSLKYCWKFLVEDRYLFFSSVVTNLYTTTGIVMLGALSSLQEVGYYSSAQKIIEVVKSVMIMPVSQIIFPILSEKFGRDKLEGLESFKKLMPIFVLLSLFILVFLLFFGKFIVLILFGVDFYPSISMLMILSFGLVSVFFGIIIGGQVMLNLGLDNVFLRIQVVVSIFSLFVSLCFVPRGGGVATAYIWSFSEFIISVFQILYLRRKGIILFDKDIFLFSSLKGSLKYVFRKDS